MSADSDQFTATVVAFDPNRQTTRTLYFAMRGFSSSPTDTPASTHFDGVLSQPADMVRTLFAPLATKGRSTTNVGDMVLRNEDGRLDTLSDLSFDGRAVTIRRGPWPMQAYPTNYSTDLVGTVGAPPDLSQKEVIIRLRDRQVLVNVPLQTTKYSGAGLGTLEGVAGDLKGKPKPVLFGKVENLPAPCVETAKLIFQVHDGSGVTLQAVYDQGLALVDAGSSYANTTDLLNNSLAPSAGQFKIYSGSEGTYFRLGSQPNGLVTCDATRGAASAAYAGTLATTILTKLGLSSSDWSASDVTALDTAAPYQLGRWYFSEVDGATVLDGCLGSVGAAWFVSSAGVYRFKQLAAPSGTPVLTFKDADILRRGTEQGLERVVPNDHGRGIPSYKTIVRYRLNHVVQETDVAAGVTQARREFLSNEWREAVATDTAVQTTHLLAVQDVDDSWLTSESDAQAEATRRQTLRRVQRDFYEFAVKLDDDTAVLELNDVIEVIHPRYGLNLVGSADDGALMRVLGLRPNARSRELTVTAWGPTVNQRNIITQDATLTYITAQSGAYLVTA